VATGRGPEFLDGAAPAAGAPINVAIPMASTYHADGVISYGREGNAVWEALEEVLGSLEGGWALTFASGMAAIAGVLETLPVGAVVVAPEDAYLGTRGLLADLAGRGRLRGRLVDITDTAATLAACEGADLLWCESPTNPMMAIADLVALSAGARNLGVPVVVDNTFATPLLQRPLDLGADVVVHSVTKFLSGHSDLVMGAAVIRDEERWGELRLRRSLHGGIPGPLEAFLALRGVRTLPVRLERAQSNAAELARRLAAHPAVSLVRYPGLPDHPGHELAARQMDGFGAMLSFELHGGAPAADALCGAVRVCVHATSLGGVETLLERRQRWEGEESTPPGLVRVSVGIEDIEDLWDDLEAALGAPATAR
jgi:cystathionine gamma-synthase